MNKQELIEILEELKKNSKRCIGIDKYEDYWRGKTEAYFNLIGLAKQLNEPQKPVVPKFVAEWFEENKDDLEFPIWELCVDSYGSKDEHGMLNWIQQSENNPIETLIRMKEGYEVEKEPLYTVTINLDRKYHLVVDEGDGNDEISTTLTTSHGVLGYRYFLTEKEIKSADENLWLIAVPVEEVAEG
ncbi:DUF1642 domain-containing protein [Enterococcus faecium]|nr:DUF1642 domain-containing protein [Enterococcus faecium]